MHDWGLLFELLVVLGAALVLGTLAEQWRQSAVLGYLVAGTLVGPNVLGLVRHDESVELIAELGVALLLFSIGLEFSFRRLRRLGRIALVGGTLQVVFTMAIGALAAIAFGASVRTAIAVGAMVALSSTACVLRLLQDRGAIDAVYGRNVLGILLLQDLAVIPLMLVVVLLSTGGTPGEVAMTLLNTLLFAGALVAGFVVFFNFIAPRILNLQRWATNRDLPILFAVVLALGAAYAAHEAHLSPAMGAFIAGVMLGESPFATQVRADVGALRTLLVTLFFSSIGMLGDPVWIAAHWPEVTGVVALILVGKTAATFFAARLLKVGVGVALATALCLAQVGEFSFVLAQTASREGTLLPETLFNLIVSATIATLFVTPFLVAGAPGAAAVVGAVRRRLLPRSEPVHEPGDEGPAPFRPVAAIIGFGPAGQSVAATLAAREHEQVVVVELSPRSVAVAQRSGLRVHQGDATHVDVLEHAGVAHARVIAITVPDATTVRTVVQLCRTLAPQATIVARSRYHVRRWEIEMAGAHEVVDEEEQVGRRIAKLVRHALLREADEETAERS